MPEHPIDSKKALARIEQRIKFNYFNYSKVDFKINTHRLLDNLSTYFKRYEFDILDLSKCNLSKMDLDSFDYLIVLLQNAKIRALNLENNNLNYDDTATIVSMCKNHATIKELAIENGNEVDKATSIMLKKLKPKSDLNLANEKQEIVKNESNKTIKRIAPTNWFDSQFSFNKIILPKSSDDSASKFVSQFDFFGNGSNSNPPPQLFSFKDFSKSAKTGLTKANEPAVKKSRKYKKKPKTPESDGYDPLSCDGAKFSDDEYHSTSDTVKVDDDKYDQFEDSDDSDVKKFTKPPTAI